MKTQWKAGLAILVTLFLWMTGTARADGPVVTDMAGRAVPVPETPGRIICLGPGALRLMVYLEAHPLVVGVEEMEKRRPEGRPYRLAWPELTRLLVIGPGGPASINKKPDLEAVLRVRPDVIFVTYMDGSLAEEMQQTLGIPVVVLSYGQLATFDEAVYEALRIAGRILNREERAGAVVEYIESLQADLTKRTESVPDARKPGVYVGGIGYRGAHGIESTEQHYIPLDWINAKNLAEDIQSRIGSHVFADREILLAINPEIIFIDGGGMMLVAEDCRRKPEFYNALKAFQTGQVYTLLPFNFYTTNIGTALADAYTIGKVLYPESFGDVDPERKADEIYTFLVGKAVYPEMKAMYGPLGARFSCGDKQ